LRRKKCFNVPKPKPRNPIVVFNHKQRNGCICKQCEYLCPSVPGCRGRPCHSASAPAERCHPIVCFWLEGPGREHLSVFVDIKITPSASSTAR
jgi:hypothetical protein